MENTKEIKKVVLYTRVSTVEQVEGFSLEAQKVEILKYCKNHGYTVVGEYEDAGISGTTINERTQFKNMLKDIAKNPNIDAVLAWKLSRISRNMLDLVEILNYLQGLGTGLITTSDNINTFTASGKTFCYLAGIFAEMERDNIVSQTINGMKQRARSGLTNGGPPPFGYQNGEKGKPIIIDPKAANVINTIFNLYTYKGYGYSKIVSALNSEPDKYPTKQGKGWTYQSVQQVLDNPTYAGYVRWGQFTNWNKKRREGKTDDYIIVKGQHVPIITEELWQLTQARRKQQKEKYTQEKLENTHYLLSGLARCPECGAAMVSQRSCRTRKSDGKKIWYRYYGCSQWANKKAICHPNLVKAEVLEKRVIGRINDFVQNPLLPELLIERMGKDIDMQELENKIQSIDKRILKLKADEDKYYKYLVDDEKLKILKMHKILENISEINEEIEHLNEEKGKLSTQLINSKSLNFDLGTISVLLKNFKTVFNNADFEQQKLLLHSIIKEIMIKPSEDINERLEESVTLRFSDLDLLNYEKDIDYQKTFEVTCDKVPLS